MPQSSSSFESAVLQQLDAAHNLARWLLRNDQDAEDVVQDSCMKAMKAFDTLRGGDFRPWFLTIVRNSSFSRLSRNKAVKGLAETQSVELSDELPAEQATYDPQAIAIRSADVQLIRSAIEQLPEVWREVIVLREMEGLTYREIGKIAGVPIGTVMSRLARGRMRLAALLTKLEGTK